jgi:Mg/Co/Ni transporter MgtE
VRDQELTSPHFEPLSAASRRALAVGAVVGPLLWLVLLVAVAVVLQRTKAVQLGLLVGAASFISSLAVLVVLRTLRRHEIRRYVDRC